MSQLMTGKQALLEMLKAEGVEFIFGNPGTSEGPIIDLLADYPELRYVLTLQESVAMGMGEAYARGTGRASFVSLHVDSGLANGIALMLDALNAGSPMVVTSANYDIRKTNETITDLANLVRPVTKWSVELSHPDQIPSVIRRAFNEANTHPKGPVYVGFTSNALEGMAEMNIVPSRPNFDAVRPSQEGIGRAAELLMDSSRPLLMVGDRVSDDDALDKAVELAELMGLPVYQARGAEVSFPTGHPQFNGCALPSGRVATRRAAGCRPRGCRGIRPVRGVVLLGRRHSAARGQPGPHRFRRGSHRPFRAHGRGHRWQLQAGTGRPGRGTEREAVAGRCCQKFSSASSRWRPTERGAGTPSRRRWRKTGTTGP